jgi:hypothetical protein
MVVSLKILIEVEFYKAHMNSRVVQGKNKYNSEN